MTAIMCGVGIIVASGIGSLIAMFSFDIFELSIGMILLFLMGIPFIGIILGVIVMMKYGNLTSGMTASMRRASMMHVGPREKSYVHEPPPKCPGCNASLSMETVEWVGPLTAKCPYCGTSVHTIKKEV